MSRIQAAAMRGARRGSLTAAQEYNQHEKQERARLRREYGNEKRKADILKLKYKAEIEYAKNKRKDSKLEQERIKLFSTRN